MVMLSFICGSDGCVVVVGGVVVREIGKVEVVSLPPGGVGVGCCSAVVVISGPVCVVVVETVVKVINGVFKGITGLNVKYRYAMAKIITRIKRRAFFIVPPLLVK